MSSEQKITEGLRDLGDRLARGETIEAIRLVRCPRCQGDGYHVIDGTCPNCGGLGMVRRNVELTARQEEVTEIVRLTRK